MKQGRFARNIALLASTTAVTQLIAVTATPILTRLYTPTQFGHLSVFAAFVALFEPISTLRYATTIPLARSRSEVNVSIVLSVVCFVAVATVTFAAMPFAHSVLPPEIGIAKWLIPPCIIMAGATQTLNGWALHQKRFDLIARRNIAQSTSLAFTKILLAFSSVVNSGLIIAAIVGRFIAVVVMLPTFYKSTSPHSIRVCPAQLSATAIRYWKFPIIQSCSQSILAWSSHVPALAIASCYGVQAAGFYAVATNILAMPLNLLGRSVGQVYFSEIATIGRDHPGDIHRLTKRIVRTLVFVGGLPVLALSVVAPYAFARILGEDWYLAGQYTQSLAFLGLVKFATTPVAHCISVFEAFHLSISANIAMLALALIVFPVAQQAALSLRTALVIYCVFASIVQVMLSVSVLTLLRRMRTTQE